MGSTARRIAGAALLIAALTVASRIVGFGRIMVFAWAVGNTDLGTVYQTANTVPNIIFEIVAGGALASLVVPLLAGAIAAGDRRAVSEISSAVLTWTLVLLVPLALVVAVAAEPIMAALSGDAPPQMVALGARMLRIFAPQLPLYGAGIVLTGVLQAHRRFAWPAFAPLLSSVTLIAAYAAFTVVDAQGARIDDLGLPGELTLSVGTTVGVAALSLCLVLPLRRIDVRLRPTLRLPAGLVPQARALAAAGAVTIGAQQVATVLVIYLANPPAPEGALVVFTIAQTVYLLPWAVLAVPVATSAYPTLADAVATDDHDSYRRSLSRTVRATLLLTSLGMAVLIAVAAPAAGIVGMLAARNPSVDALTAGIVGFAPGLVGYGLFALLSRALYARGEAKLVAWAAVGGWGATAVAMTTLAAVLPAEDRVLALAVGNSVGMVVLGVALLVIVRVRAGADVVAGGLRSGVTGFAAAAVAAAAGVAASQASAGVLGVPPTATTAVLQGILSAVVVAAVFAGVVLIADRRDAQLLTARLRRAVPARGGGHTSDAQAQPVQQEQEETVR